MSTLDFITTVVIGLHQSLCTYFLFKIRRLKSGIISFENKLSNELSVIVCIIVLFLASLAYMKCNINSSTILVFSIAFIGILFYFYFRQTITARYVNKVQKRNSDILENELNEQKQKVLELNNRNSELSKIIHRDNKLIPSMLIAIEDILNCSSPEEQKQKSLDLLPQLEAMAEERSGILNKYEIKNKKLPSTGFISLDSSLKYLLNKASENSISLDLSVTADTDTLNVIDENDFNTLILDLVENAIIATSSSENRNIFIVICSEYQNLSISIYDSGNHFHPDIIENLGIRRITTHKKSGGSGIGMMTVFELLNKYQASFLLNELIENENYTKEIKILFDRKNEYRIITQRKELKDIIRKRTDINFN